MYTFWDQGVILPLWAKGGLAFNGISKDTNMKHLALALAMAFAASAASAAIVSTNNFETAYDGFSADGGDIASLVSLVDYEQSGQPSGPAPAPFSDFGSKYLSLDTDDAMVWRTFTEQSSDVYFDSYVKMTPCSGDIEYTSDAKFVVFLNADTNLCVISGTSASNHAPVTNVLAAVSQVESWHRLTVCASADGGYTFSVFLDGTRLGGTETFYSLVAGTTMSNVGLNGTGAIDDLVVRTTAPVLSGTAAATIDGEDFATLAQAAAEAAAGDTILLESDSSENITLSVAGIVFNTNGKNYTGTVSAASGLGWTEENGVYTSSANTAATWTGSVDNRWSNADNWSTHGVPTAATTVTLPDGATIEATGTSALPVDSMIVNGAVKLTCTGDLANNWPSIGIKGSVSGSGTLTLERFGLTSSDNDQVTVGCNISFDGKTADSFLQSGTFVLDGSVTGTNKFQLLANTTFNGAVTIPDGAILSVGRNGTAATATFGEESSLSGAGTVALWSNGDDARTYAGFTSIKTKLKTSSWTGVCELSGTMTAIDFSYFGHSGSTVRANGLSGFLRYSAGSTTKIANGIKALDIGNSGFTMDNQFSSGAACNYEFDAALTGAGTLTFGTKHQNTADVKSFYTINGDVSEFTGTVQFGSQLYRPVVVFKASGDVVPEPTDWGQIMITSNKSVNVCAAWNSPGGYWIRGTANVSSAGSLVCGAGTQKIAGDGVIRYVAAPGSNPELSSSVWTGTVVLDYAVGNHIDFAAIVNSFGTADSTVEIGANGTIVEGYFNAKVIPTLKVTGYVHVNDGSSANPRNFTKVTGSGVLVFGTKGAMVNYVIDNLVDWNGTMTNGSSNASLTNIVSGTGSIVFNAAPSTRPMAGPDWRGTAIIGWNPGAADTAFDINNYGMAANATIQIDGVNGEFVAFPREGDTVANVTAKIVLNANWSIGNGWNNKTNTFAYLTGPGDITVRNVSGYYYGRIFNIKELDGYTGTLGGDNGQFVVDTVNVDSMPAAEARVVKTAKGTYGAISGNLALTVGNEATGQYLVYATLAAGEGLYKAVAQYGGNYYATFQDAINAKSSAGGTGDIVVLDASAAVPVGYKIVDGKLVRKFSGAMINFF